MSDVYCLLPWVHFQVWPNGDVFPCCFSANDYEANKVGNISEYASLSDIANSDKLKSLRARMRDGGPLPECQTCVKSEEMSGHSFRLDFKESFKDYDASEVIDTMAEDGTLTDFKMRYMDTRFSTTCNQKCRTCGPHFSSSWAAESKFPIKVQKIEDKSQAIHDELIAKANDVDVFYFAGGEPLVTPQHFEILESIDMSGKVVAYNTNFSNLDWKNYNVVDTWKTIPRLTIHASVDATYDKYEYMRSGTKFDTIIKHFNRFHSEVENSYKKISINLTVSALNIFYLPEIIKDFEALGFIREDGLPLNISFVFNPVHFKPTIFPAEVKKVIEAKLLDFVKDNGRYQGIHAAINYMNSENDERYMAAFWHEINRIDEIRGEWFDDTFLELNELLING